MLEIDPEIITPEIAQFLQNWYQDWHESKMTYQKQVFIKSANRFVEVKDAQKFMITAMIDDLIQDPDCMKLACQYIPDNFDLIIDNGNFLTQLEQAVPLVSAADIAQVTKPKIMLAILNAHNSMLTKSQIG